MKWGPHAWYKHFTYWTVSPFLPPFQIYWETVIHSRAICSSYCVGEWSRKNLNPKAQISKWTKDFYCIGVHALSSIVLPISDKTECLLTVTQELWGVEEDLHECVRTGGSSEWMYFVDMSVAMSRAPVPQIQGEWQLLPRVRLREMANLPSPGADIDSVHKMLICFLLLDFCSPRLLLYRDLLLWLAKLASLFNCVQLAWFRCIKYTHAMSF